MIVQQLNQIQEHYGYLPRESLVALAERLAVPLYRIQEVASFYPHYRRAPPPAVEVHVCRDMSCCLRGSPRLVQSLEQTLAGEIANGRAAVCPVSCLGHCDRAPAARIYQHSGAHAVHNYLGRSADEITAAVQSLLAGERLLQRLHESRRAAQAAAHVAANVNFDGRWRSAAIMRIEAGHLLNAIQRHRQPLGQGDERLARQVAVMLLNLVELLNDHGEPPVTRLTGSMAAMTLFT